MIVTCRGMLLKMTGEVETPSFSSRCRSKKALLFSRSAINRLGFQVFQVSIWKVN